MLSERAFVANPFKGDQWHYAVKGGTSTVFVSYRKPQGSQPAMAPLGDLGVKAKKVVGGVVH